MQGESVSLDSTHINAFILYCFIDSEIIIWIVGCGGGGLIKS